MDQRLKIFTGGAHPDLVKSICNHLSIREGQIYHTCFSDGELYCQIEESVRGCDTFVVQPTCFPVTENLMRLLIVIDALKRASAASVTAVIPYFGYSRQEKKSTGREPITAKLVANLLTTAGASRVLTVDLHTSALQGFFDIPVDHLSAIPILAKFLVDKGIPDLTVVSPDSGGVARAREFAKRLRAPLAIIDKRRPEPNKAVIMNVIGEVDHRNVVIIDDIIDTAGTVVKVAEILRQKGAKDILVACTHPILSGPAIERISASCISKLYTTDSIPLTEAKRKEARIEVISVAPLIGETIRRVFERCSVSDLFV